MKILVMGSGAIGGYYGAVLFSSGHEVTFVARGAHLDAIKRDGLRVESVKSGDFTIRPRAVEKPDDSWKADLALFCVKGYDNPVAIKVMEPAVSPDTAIVTLQNGIGSGDELAAVFGRERVLLGATYIDAVRKGPGVVAETGGLTGIVFGERDGGQSPRAVRIRNAFVEAGIDCELSSSVATELWKKLIFICALSGMTCITNGTLAEVLDTPETNALGLQVMREAAAVAVASGVELDEDVVEDRMAALEAGKHTFRSSMKTDLDRGNPLEVGVLNGAVARLGKELGMATPVNEFITACLAVPHNRAMSGRR